MSTKFEKILPYTFLRSKFLLAPTEWTFLATLYYKIRGAGMLIIWTDGDREGENIGMEVGRNKNNRVE